MDPKGVIPYLWLEMRSVKHQCPGRKQYVFTWLLSCHGRQCFEILKQTDVGKIKDELKKLDIQIAKKKEVLDSGETFWARKTT